MIDVFEAAPDEIDQLVQLEVALFAEDAGRHDPYADTTWPSREGRKDFEDLMSSPDSIVIAARRSDGGDRLSRWLRPPVLADSKASRVRSPAIDVCLSKRPQKWRSDNAG